MRFIVDIEAAADGVEGRLRREADEIERPFHGWVQLIALLEPPAPRPPPGRPGKPEERKFP
jgi:hypothetical protein